MYVLKQNLWNLSIDNAPVALSIEYKMFDTFLSNTPIPQNIQYFFYRFSNTPVPLMHYSWV